MMGEEMLRGSLASLEVNSDFSEAVLLLQDGSRLWFRHRVGERWVRAVAPPEAAGETAAGRVLALIGQFRLNGKHLDVQFQDGSRWEARFGGGAG
jgi:hypothetical protein